jgi:hypothetical protein
MKEFASPYVSMGNNPISKVDPNGGCSTCIVGLARAAEAITIGIADLMGGLFAVSAYVGWTEGGPILNEKFDAIVDGIPGLLMKAGVPAKALYPSSVLSKGGELLPVVGNIVSTHANRKDNPNPHDVYEIYGMGAEGRQTLKFGIADQKYSIMAEGIRGQLCS